MVWTEKPHHAVYLKRADVASAGRLTAAVALTVHDCLECHAPIVLLQYVYVPDQFVGALKSASSWDCSKATRISRGTRPLSESPGQPLRRAQVRIAAN